jgi:hypothetical protein
MAACEGRLGFEKNIVHEGVALFIWRLMRARTIRQKLIPKKRLQTKIQPRHISAQPKRTKKQNRRKTENHHDN